MADESAKRARPETEEEEAAADEEEEPFLCLSDDEYEEEEAAADEEEEDNEVCDNITFMRSTVKLLFRVVVYRMYRCSHYERWAKWRRKTAATAGPPRTRLCLMASFPSP